MGHMFWAQRLARENTMENTTHSDYPINLGL